MRNLFMRNHSQRRLFITCLIIFTYATAFQTQQAITKTTQTFVNNQQGWPSSTNYKGNKPNPSSTNVLLNRVFEKQATLKTTSIYASTSEPTPELDTDALVKYGSSVAIQMSIITSLFFGLDTLINTTGIAAPFPVVVALFYFFSLKSRTFNPLNNQRPNLKKAVEGGKPSKGFRDRTMPSWTPPGVVFPIMWLLVIGPIRSYTSALVYAANGNHLCDAAILSLMLHLSIGDVWNTINNTEKRFGAAIPSVMLVFASAANAAYQYGQVDPFAGKLLGGTLVWFSIASTLIAETWRINPDPITGERDPLYPVAGREIKTEFAWFGKGEN